MRNVLCFLILIAMFVGKINAQSPFYSARVDTNDQLRIVSFDDSALDIYRNDPAYDYKLARVITESLWQKIERWFEERVLRRMFDFGAQTALSTLLFIISMIGAALLLYYLFSGKRKNEFIRRDMQIGDVFDNPTKVDKIQFDQWMAEAEKNQDFNEALKHLYLANIKIIDERNLVHYRPNFTNRQIAAKIKDPTIKSYFNELSRTFEFVWFGHFDIDKSSYYKLKDDYLKLLA